MNVHCHSCKSQATAASHRREVPSNSLADVYGQESTPVEVG